MRRQSSGGNRWQRKILKKKGYVRSVTSRGTRSNNRRSDCQPQSFKTD
jgi:hypothetical protein